MARHGVKQPCTQAENIASQCAPAPEQPDNVAGGIQRPPESLCQRHASVALPLAPEVDVLPALRVALAGNSASLRDSWLH
jgi:hypothetical protein